MTIWVLAFVVAPDADCDGSDNSQTDEDYVFLLLRHEVKTNRECDSMGRVFYQGNLLVTHCLKKNIRFIEL
jgi:hypothetical protein